MAKKDKKRSAEEAGLVAVQPGATGASAVGMPTADEAETSTTMQIDGEGEARKSKKSKKDKTEKDKDKSKKKKKDKSSKEDGGVVDDVSKELEIPAEALSPIARPLAGRKLAKKTLKTVKKAARARHVKRGVKEVVKSLKKGEKGLVVMAGDISPMDIISHIPVLCEESNAAYVFVTSKELLGRASSTKRPTSCIMICPNSKRKPRKARPDGTPAKEPEDYSETYSEIVKEIETLDQKIIY